MIGEIENAQREFGDFQTPIDFCRDICNLLKNRHLVEPDIVFEPTCGIGNFLEATSIVFTPKIQYGIDINKTYCDMVYKRNLQNTEVTNDNIFVYDFISLKSKNFSQSNWLVIGNPPWANNSFLSSATSQNLPQKSNFKQLSGFDAMTGSSNFDICEYIILQLIRSFCNENATIAMLCKTLVARNVFKELNRTETKIKDISIYQFDAKKVFDISADSCLLVINFRRNKNNYIATCPVFSFYDPQNATSEFGYIGNKFYSNIQADTSIDGKSCFTWRQGIKHDCSKIMELSKKEEKLVNGFGQIINIEDTYIYPLLKSSKIKTPIINSTNKMVIVTQKKVGEDTYDIAANAPKTWAYLLNNQHLLDARKSSIYKNAPRFSMFGIGEYSYANYKVAVSGFYKNPIFALVFSDRPVMLDDTCYFLSFAKKEDAYVVMLILNSTLVQEFIKSIAFMDSKRPYTKKVLERIDFQKCISKLSYQDLESTEKNLLLQPYLTFEMYENFKTDVTEV